MGNPDLVRRLLLGHGADLEAQSHIHTTALDLAAEQGNVLHKFCLIFVRVFMHSVGIFGRHHIPHPELAISTPYCSSRSVEEQFDIQNRALAGKIVAQLLLEHSSIVHVRIGWTSLHYASSHQSRQQEARAAVCGLGS
jgi:ankyrin repeat protein